MCVWSFAGWLIPLSSLLTTIRFAREASELLNLTSMKCPFATPWSLGPAVTCIWSYTTHLRTYRTCQALTLDSPWPHLRRGSLWWESAWALGAGSGGSDPSFSTCQWYVFGEVSQPLCFTLRITGDNPLVHLACSHGPLVAAQGLQGARASVVVAHGLTGLRHAGS